MTTLIKKSINEVLAETAKETESNQFYFNEFVCNEKTLANRFKIVKIQLNQLVKNGIIDGDKHYFYVNNIKPEGSSIQDDILFSRIDNDEFVGGVTPRIGTKGKVGMCSFWKESDKSDAEELKTWGAFKDYAKISDLTFGEAPEVIKTIPKAKPAKKAPKVQKAKKETKAKVQKSPESDEFLSADELDEVPVIEDNYDIGSYDDDLDSIIGDLVNF